MSNWTDIRDSIEQGLGIATPTQAVKTVADNIRPIALPVIAAATQPPARTPVLTPPSDVAVSRSSGSGMLATKIAGLEMSTVAILAVGAYFLLSGGKPRRV